MPDTCQRADLGLRTGAAVALVGCALALAALPARPAVDDDPPGG